MRIFLFEHEVSVPIADSDGEVRAGSITGGATDIQVDVVHVPPGGRFDIGVEGRVFLGVVAGSGWLGAGLDRRPAGPGTGGLWDSGEAGEAGSPDGMTALRVAGEFAVRALAVSQEIVVEDYDPAWPLRFEEIRLVVWPAVAGSALRIDHVGSTSVPGLAAKPIIDMDVVVAGPSDVRPVIDGLEAIGYRWRGDLGVVGRQAFAPPDRPADAGSETGLARHHLYVVVEDDKAHLDHWLLRDLLREDEAARLQYAELKRRNVTLAAGDMGVYVAAKAALVASFLARARSERGLPPAEYWDPEVGAR